MRLRHTDGVVPELPDVESYRRYFDRYAAGRTVATIVTPDPVSVRNTTPRTIDRALRGRRFDGALRHGKWLTCWTDGPALLIHFGMTGYLVSSSEEPERHRHDRLIVVLHDGSELRYRNLRKFGGVWLAHDSVEAARITGELGPDALGLPRRHFLERLARRRGGLKATLMDQRFVAGVGNLVADEVLWRARLHPRRDVATLNDGERARLHSALTRVLREWVEHYGAATKRRTWLMSVRGAPGAGCPRCRTPLDRTTAAGRTTYFCPACQRR